METGKLYIVPTPIGNLADITYRAVKILSEVDIIACEDTRVSKKLLNHYEITDKRLISYHNFNERSISSKLVALIEQGRDIAVVSDAGSPGISDPGYRIVNACIDKNIEIIALPGATAMIPALTASGMPTNEFKFMGFPPQKKGRKTFIEKMLDSDCTVIIYESVHRVIKFLNEIHNIEPERKISLGREISKIFEEYRRGEPLSIANYLEENNKVKGEFVLIIDAKPVRSKKDYNERKDSKNKYDNKKDNKYEKK